MKDEVLVLGEKEEYLCYRYYPGNNVKAKSINNALESLRKVLHGLKYSKDVSKVDFDLYVYDSSKSNALSKKEENGYIIAISSYLLFDIIDDIVSYMLNNDLRKYFYGHKLNAKKHAYKIHNYILLYIALHENYHILNGHCDAICSINHACVRKRTLDNEKNFFKQFLEMDADYCAVRSLIYLLIENTDKENLDTETMLIGFSLYFILLKFQEESYENITTIDVNKMDHPPASIRIHYSLSIILAYLKEIMKKEHLLYLMNEVTELCVYFDRVYYDSDAIELALFAYAYTFAGQEYAKTLYNGWKMVKEKISDYAYISLREDSNSNEKNMHFLNNDGKLLKVLNIETRVSDFWKSVLKL